jgi:hypothetical protein
VKILFEEKEELRRVYDHYEKKLEELLQLKEHKLRKGGIDEKFQLKLQRNEDKFSKSKIDYLNKCLLTFDTMDELMNSRFNLFSQPLLTVIIYL